ncbi:MAG TPA: AMP-binding protein [Stellaceae bacterium]|nr:AMP-binding protein [Stellaceae bacterium]HYM04737.1 AMP-binding protein [Stellaceae bacterium]
MADFETLHGLRSLLATYGEHAAIIAFGRDTEEVWSFAQLDHHAAQLTAGLAGRGVAVGDGVALIAPNSPRWITAFWGIVSAGAVAVPLDAQNEDSALARMIETAGCRLAFTTALNAERVRSLAPSCMLVIIDQDDGTEPGASWHGLLAPPLPRQPSAAPADVAVIAFTSGTTGTPKAVPLTHANLLTNVRALCALRIVGPSDRALLPLPLHHVYPLTIGMLTPLALGCGIVLPQGVSGPELLSAMRRGGATVLVGVPRLYSALLDNIRRGIASRPAPVAATLRSLIVFGVWAHRHAAAALARPLSRSLRRQVAPGLRLLVSGGAAIAAEVEEALDGMGWEMLTGYGLVETSSMLTFNPPGAALPGSAGRPVPGMELRIAEPDRDGSGEIEAHGPSVFGGYRGDAARTREAFTADGWFRTGDLGFIDRRGYLHITGRKTETIVLADGKKIFPEGFEEIYGTAPLVREIALLGVEGALVGLVVPDLDASRKAGALRLGEALREGLAAKAASLPSYARLSGFAATQGPLPRTQLGKLKRHLLPALYRAAQRHEPALRTFELSAEDRSLLGAPSGAAVWQWLTQRFPDQGLRPDTVLQLELGIDSLAWIELSLALERDLGIVLHEEEIARIVTARDFVQEATVACERRAVAGPVAAPEWIAPPKFGGRLLRAAGVVLVRFIMRQAFRLRVEGSECLPPNDPIVICANHASYLDPFALASALPSARLRRTFWGGWTGVVFTTRLRRYFSRIAQVIPIDPDRAVISGIAAGRLVLERGYNLVWFPEGSRSENGRLQRFLPGIGALVAGGTALIVPVYIGGSFAAWPVRQRFPRLHPVVIRFGPPIVPPPVRPGQSARQWEDDIAIKVQTAVAALAVGEGR